MAGARIGVVAALAACMLVLAIPWTAAPVKAQVSPIDITLYGNAGFGWAYNASDLTKPVKGPTIILYEGDVVNLTLIGTDPVKHNWFIDYNNDSNDNDGGPSSPDFAGSTPVSYEFIADRAGNYTYRCVYHAGSMTGLIQIRPPRAMSYRLVGNAGFGWGFNYTNISRPGPTLLVYQGGAVTLTLNATDGLPHTWFIDYNNDSKVDNDEPVSPEFHESTPFVWSFIPDRVGNFTYRCGVHPGTMFGKIVVVYTGAGEQAASGGPVIELVPAIMAGTLGFVFLFAAGYHLRAVRAHRKVK